MLETLEHLCKCGCGETPKIGNTFILYHHNRLKTVIKLCKCGCGEITQAPRRKYVDGHLNQKDKVYSAKAVEKQKQTIKERKENPPTPQLCECGCEKFARVKSRYINGHYTASLNKKIAQGCACGCKEITTPGRQYISGHNPRPQFAKGVESYPEKYFREFLEKMGAIEGLDFVQEHQVGKYRLDFAYMAGKIYIEIDGGQHLLPEAIEHDRIRDEWLETQGWVGMRIPVKELPSLLESYTSGVIDKS